MEEIDDTNVWSFSAEGRLRQFRQTYWCTSRTPSYANWPRISVFGIPLERLQTDLNRISQKLKLKGNETVCCDVGDGRVVMRLSPDAAKAMGIDTHYVLPPGNAYRGYVDALMAVLHGEEPEAAVKAWQRCADLHQKVLTDKEKPVRGKRRTGVGELSAVETSAMEAGKGLMRAVCAQPSWEPLLHPAMMRAVEEVLAQAEREAIFRCFPQEAAKDMSRQRAR